MKDFKASLDEILPTKPDLIFFGGIYTQITEFIKQARGRGYTGMFLAPDGLDSSEAAVIAGSSLLQGKGTYYTAVAGPASIYPGGAQFVKDFKARYNHDPLPFAAQVYDAMGICLKGIENASTAKNNQMPSRAAVSAQVRALQDYKGITGTINFDQKGDRLLADYFVIQVSTATPARWLNNKIVQTIEITPP